MKQILMLVAAFAVITQDDNNGQSESGSAFIFFGSDPFAQLSLRADAEADVILNGQSTRDFFGVPVASAGDFNGDTGVTQADLDILEGNWHCDEDGRSACIDFTAEPPPAMGAAVASVPEPSSLLLATAGLLGFLLVGWRRWMVTC